MEQQQQNREDRILESLAGIEKAKAPDFFYTRLVGRMQHEQEPVKQPIFVLQPVFITGALSIFLMINVFLLVQWNKTPQPQADQLKTETVTIESFARAYNMETESVYE